MGRYENTLKYVQLRSLIEDKKFDEALEKAKQLELKKIKDVSELKLIADVYRKCGDFARAKELYYKIYDEQKIRKNLYNLIMLCLKNKDFDEAESLYEEYLVIDKDSIYRYILKYRIDKSKGMDIGTVIADLEVIKKEYYMEDWAYELAKQYHKAGMIESCIEECNDIILWFGEGELVEKARLLKMHYENSFYEEIEDLQNDIDSDLSNYNANRGRGAVPDVDYSATVELNALRGILPQEDEYQQAAGYEGSDYEEDADRSSGYENVDYVAETGENRASDYAGDEYQQNEEYLTPDQSGQDYKEDVTVSSETRKKSSKIKADLYNGDDKEKILNGALSAAAVIKNSIAKEPAPAAADVSDVTIKDVSEIQFESELESELAENIAVQMNRESMFFGNNIIAGEEKTAGRDDSGASDNGIGSDEPVGDESVNDGSADSETVHGGLTSGDLSSDDSARDGSVRDTSANAGTSSDDSIRDINIETPSGPQLSKYGSKINYITEEELYKKMAVSITAPSNFAIALSENNSATDVVKEIAKRIGEAGFIDEPKVAKISAGRLNSINLADYVDDLLGTCIMVENAANMTSKTVNGIIKAIDANPSALVIILVDREELLSKFLLKEAVLGNQISSFVVY